MRSKNIARIAGLLYLVAGGTMAFTELYIRSKLMIWGDPSATAASIMNSEFLFRLGIVCDLFGMTCFVAVPLVLYKLFNGIDKVSAILMALLALISIPIMCINVVNEFAILLLLNGNDYLVGFDSVQIHGLIMFFSELHSYGYLIAQIFFGLWLFPLGILVIKSRLFPDVLGLLLIVASTAYMIQLLFIFLWPDYSSIVSPITNALFGLGELIFIFWLIIIGTRSPKSLVNGTTPELEE